MRVFTFMTHLAVRDMARFVRSLGVQKISLLQIVVTLEVLQRAFPEKLSNQASIQIHVSLVSILSVAN